MMYFWDFFFPATANAAKGNVITGPTDIKDFVWMPANKFGKNSPSNGLKLCLLFLLTLLI